MNVIAPLHIGKILLTETSGMTDGGRFHSVFRNCLFALTDRKYLFNVISEDVCINPRGIQVSLKDWDECLIHEVVAGDEFYINEQILYVSDPDIVLDLNKARVWDPCAKQILDLPIRALIRNNLKKAEQFLNAREERYRSPNILESFLRGELKISGRHSGEVRCFRSKRLSVQS